MPIHYIIYGNDGAGGPIDYGTPLGETDQLSFDTLALGTPSDNRFAVRAHDAITGHEEHNVDAVVRIVVDAAGVDITERPAAPISLSARAEDAGAILVRWSFDRLASGGTPTGWRVWITAGSTVNYGAAPAATVAYTGPSVDYTATLGALVDGQDYAIGVRAYNAHGEGPEAGPVLVTADATGPDSVDALTCQVF